MHSHDVGPMLWLYRQTVRPPSAPLVVTMHTLMSRFLRTARCRCWRRTCGRSTSSRRCSWSVADDVIAIEPRVAERLTVIRSGVVPPPQLPTPVSVDPPRLLYVGRLIDLKRVDLVVEATARLVTQLPSLRLSIAGAGPNEADLRAQAVALGIADRVDFLGLVDRDRVFELLAASSVVVMPSDFEGLPLVALEARVDGPPGGGGEITGPGRRGRRWRDGLPRGRRRRRRVHRGVGRPARRSDAGPSDGRIGRVRAEREFSLEVCVDRYEALYERVVAQGPASERVWPNR